MLDYCIPKSARVVARLRRAPIKLTRVIGGLFQRFKPPQLGIVGCYDTGNIGDLALGWTLRRLAARREASCALQPMGNLRLFPATASTVIGGGGVMTAKYVSALLRHCRDHVSRTAIIGVSGFLAAADLPEGALEFLQHIPYFSVRNRIDMEAWCATLGRRDIILQPDVVFAIARAFGFDPAASERKERVLGLNVAPIFMRQNGSRFVVNEELLKWFKINNPEVAEVYHLMGESYVRCIQKVVDIYRGRGYAVRCVPFAIEDDLFARTILRRQALVEFVPYSRNPLSVLKTVAENSLFVATRFHSHVYAMLSAVPLLSIAYALKCRYVWEDMHLSPSGQVDRLDLVRNERQSVDHLVTEAGVLPEVSVLKATQEGAVIACDRGLAVASQGGRQADGANDAD